MLTYYEQVRTIFFVMTGFRDRCDVDVDACCLSVQNKNKKNKKTPHPRVCIFINTSHETTTFLVSLGSVITLAIAYTWAHLLYRLTFRRAGAFLFFANGWLGSGCGAPLPACSVTGDPRSSFWGNGPAFSDVDVSLLPPLALQTAILHFFFCN